MAEEGETRQKKRSRGGEGDATRVDVGDGAWVMPGVGESYWNVAGVDRAVKIYNTGVLEGQLTLSRGYDWADTMANCEDAVGSIAFWGQIATHLSSMEYRGATATGYFNKLFNLPGWHGSRWDRQSARFLRGAREGRFSNEPVVVSIAAQRKQDVFREYSVGKLSLKIFLFVCTILYGRGQYLESGQGHAVAAGVLQERESLWAVVRARRRPLELSQPAFVRRKLCF